MNLGEFRGHEFRGHNTDTNSGTNSETTIPGQFRNSVDTIQNYALNNSGDTIQNYVLEAVTEKCINDQVKILTEYDNLSSFFHTKLLLITQPISVQYLKKLSTN